MPPLKDTFFLPLPSGQVVPVVIVELADGRLVARHPDEVPEIAPPTAPARE